MFNFVEDNTNIKNENYNKQTDEKPVNKIIININNNINNNIHTGPILKQMRRNSVEYNQEGNIKINF